MPSYRTFILATTVPADTGDHIHFALEALCRGAHESTGATIVRELDPDGVDAKLAHGLALGDLTGWDDAERTTAALNSARFIMDIDAIAS